MAALDFLLDPNMAPFTGALALVAGLLVIELLASLVGGSLMAGGSDGPDLDLGADGIDGADALDGVDIDGPDIDGPEIEGLEGAPAGAGGIAAWLGFGQVPFILWLAGLLTAFGLIGYGVQVASTTAFGGLIPWWGATAIAAVPSLWVGGVFARTLGRLIPKTESSAISRRSLGDRRAVIAQGTARRGNPAQARVRDLYGNLHYVRVEPVDDDTELPRGTEVILMDGRGPVLFAIPIDETK
jgi:hypothetical protein